MDVQEAQESQQKVMVAIGQNCGTSRGSRDLATFHAEGRQARTSLRLFLDGDWACDDLDRKSASGGYLMVGGCRLHKPQQDDWTTRAQQW